MYWYSGECFCSSIKLNTAITVPIFLIVRPPSAANLNLMVFPFFFQNILWVQKMLCVLAIMSGILPHSQDEQLLFWRLQNIIKKGSSVQYHLLCCACMYKFVLNIFYFF